MRLQYLLSNNHGELKDFDLKSATEHDREFALFETKEQERISEMLFPIRMVDNILLQLHCYSRYKRQGFIDIVEGLNIIDYEDSFYIENVAGGRVLCSLTLNKNNKKDNLRTFYVQTINKKGMLGNREEVGVYTKKYECLDRFPKYPDEKQMNAIISINKKIEKNLVPLNNAAASRYYAKEEAIKRTRTKKEG